MILRGRSPTCSRWVSGAEEHRGRRAMDEWLSKPTKMGVLASGGAPNLHLIAGALCAFYENKRSFDVIGASGAGALAGLLYAVPKQPGGPGAGHRADRQHQCLRRDLSVAADEL